MTGYQSKKAAAQDKLAQPAQEPPPWWPAVENILKEYGLSAIDFVADFKAALAQPEQRPWVDLTENEIEVIEVMALTKAWAIRMTMAHLKERNT